MSFVFYFFRAVLLLLTACCFSTNTRAADVDSDSFAKVSQVFIKNCVSCHSEAGKIRGGLDLTTAEKVLAGGSSGAINRKPDDPDGPTGSHAAHAAERSIAAG